MQGELPHAETQSNTTIELPPLDVEHTTERLLLKSYAVLLEARFPQGNIPGNQLIADITGGSVSWVNKALEGLTSIGDDAWLKVESAARFWGHNEWNNKRRILAEMRTNEEESK